MDKHGLHAATPRNNAHAAAVESPRGEPGPTPSCPPQPPSPSASHASAEGVGSSEDKGGDRRGGKDGVEC